MVRRADRVITCSDYMRGHVADVFGVAKRRITTIPNGVDPADLEPVEKIDIWKRSARALREAREKLILLVGRLVYEKGFHLALEALPRVIKELGKTSASSSRHRKLPRRTSRRRRAKLGLTRHGTFIGWTGDDTLHSLYRVADCASCRRSTSRSAWSRSRRWRRAACAWWRTPAGCARSSPRAAGPRCASASRVRDRSGAAREMLTDQALREALIAEAGEHVRSFRLGRGPRARPRASTTPLVATGAATA